jgi:hypothetical protein
MTTPTMTTINTKTKKMSTTAAFPTREAWLEALIDQLRPTFEKAGHRIPERVRVSVGFPSSRGAIKHVKAIGQCWPGHLAEDGVPQIFVSPVLDEQNAAETVVHELVHAAVGCGHGHRGPFKACALAVGLMSPMRTTPASPELTQRLTALCEQLGPFPHARLRESHDRKKQGIRQIKLVCGCGRIIRASRQVADGPPIICGGCKGNFLVARASPNAPPAVVTVMSGASPAAPMSPSALSGDAIASSKLVRSFTKLLPKLSPSELDTLRAVATRRKEQLATGIDEDREFRLQIARYYDEKGRRRKTARPSGESQP